MKYISLSNKDKKEMMDAIGISSIEELFNSIPSGLKLKKALDLSHPHTEQELLDYFDKVRSQNKYTEYLSFLGGGVYNHFIPYLVDYLSSRGEFLTPYTPYQPEVSQGTLQVIFEYQTLISQLTGLEVSNASLYDGASAAAEAVLMSHRINGRPKILIANTLHPQYREVIRTYIKNVSIEVEEFGYSSTGEVDLDDLRKRINEETSAVVIQSPNFMGVIENIEEISELSHQYQALSVVVVTEPISLGILEAPGKLGADVVTGEGQSFGIPPSFGGPYLGFMACPQDFLRQLPGRIAGQTTDVEGRRGFVLTLSTREQHIRRERATSNICTNQAWCALRAAIFLETLGKEGLKELAWQNIQKAHYAFENLCLITGVTKRFTGTVFNEFVLQFPKECSEVEDFLRKKKIVAALDLEKFYPELKNCGLFSVTEMHRKEDIDRLIQAMEELLR